MQVHIPTPLRAYTGQQATVSVEAVTIQNALDQLVATHPELKRHLFTEDGKLRAFVNLYLNEEDVRYLTEKEYTVVKADDELSIIPSIAGGSSSHARVLSGRATPSAG
jgi:molybdopterin converting factor small subunit